MDTKALEKFCPWARTELIDAVGRRCARFGLDDAGRADAGPESDVVGGRVLAAAERAQRAALYARVESEGWETFCEREAYGWFNRLVAIRYMEVRGFLPCRVRMLSAQDGSFDPECLRMLGELDLPGLDVPAALRLSVEGRAEDAYRMVLVAQCNQLAAALPDVFGAVSAADALTLPDGLLLAGEHNVLYHLVADVPEDAWADVEALGWSYQFYNSERKDDFFNSKRKAAPEDIAPATQLFTPEWIVRYMVENSLGRLWMLNHPQSQLRDRMAYYIEPEADAAEDFLRVSSPEDITVCDPACGSGHILSYAFELLMAMYEEMGYRERDAASLILEKNLSGMEIDPRAAQIASLVLAMRAREHDRRFLTRQEAPKADITVLQSVPLAEGDLTLCGTKLPQALQHLGELGSLLAPSEEDVQNLRTELDRCKGDLLDNGRANRVAEALNMCESLARRFDVVVANPPYMGSNNFNEFMSKWVKANYPDVKAELCCCFISRALSLAKSGGMISMVTMQSWLFSDTYKAMRLNLLGSNGVLNMIHIGSRGFDSISGEIVSTTAFVIQAEGDPHAKGLYFKLTDFQGEHDKSVAFRNALGVSNSPLKFKASYSDFSQIDSCPVAYWASASLLNAFSALQPLSDYSLPLQGLATTNNDLFLRNWWEVALARSSFSSETRKDALASKKAWFPHCKGGSFRKWYGNRELLINWENDGKDLYKLITERYGSPSKRIVNAGSYFKCGVTYSDVSTGAFSCRFTSNATFDVTGPVLIASGNQLYALLACLNSSSFQEFLLISSPGLHYKNGVLANLPAPIDDASARVELLCCAKDALGISKCDYDSFETSWDFKRHPLL